MSSGVSKLFQKKKAKAAEASAVGGAKASSKASSSSAAATDGGDDEWLDSSAAAAPRVRVVTAGKRVDDLCVVQKEATVANEDIAMKIQIEENRRLLQEARLRQQEAERAIAEEEAAKKAAKQQQAEASIRTGGPESAVSGRAGLGAIDWAAKRAERLAKDGHATAAAPKEDFPALGAATAPKSSLPKAPVSPGAPVKEQENAMENPSTVPAAASTSAPVVIESARPPEPPESAGVVQEASPVAPIPEPPAPQPLPPVENAAATPDATEVVAAQANALSVEANSNNDTSSAGVSAETGKKKKKSSYIDF